MVRVLTDGDACPVKKELAKLAKLYHFDWWIFIDVSHVLFENQAHIIYCDQQKDSVDLVLMNEAKAQDIVVTADLGLAALALAKGCQVMDFDGRILTDQDMDGLLFQRYAHQKMRQKKIRVKSKRARSKSDDQRFYTSLATLLEEIYDKK